MDQNVRSSAAGGSRARTSTRRSGCRWSASCAATEHARERLGPLEVTAAAFERGATRVVLCGVDTLAIQSPEVDAIRERVAAATGATRAGVLLNWNHTHHAPPGGRSVYGSFGERDPEPDATTLAYVEGLHDAIVETCARAFERLEHGRALGARPRRRSPINRRAARPRRQGAQIGWNPDGLVDRSVPVLQSVRDGRQRDRHRRRLRRAHGHDRRRATSATRPTTRAGCATSCATLTGGECVFLQGAAGNVMPLRRLRRRSARADRDGPAAGGSRRCTPSPTGRPGRCELAQTDSAPARRSSSSAAQPADGEAPVLAAAEERGRLPAAAAADRRRRSQPSSSEAEREVAEAEARGATEAELRVLRFHGLNWARRTRRRSPRGTPRTSVRAAGRRRSGSATRRSSPARARSSRRSGSR